MSMQHRNENDKRDSDLETEAAERTPKEGLQLKRSGEGDVTGDPHTIAASGFGGGGSELPHRAAIEASFGQPVDAKAHVGQSDACDQLGAQAYASGDQVAFREQSPDLHLAAHEAAHVVQQKQGVHLKDGLGAGNDAYEVQADQAADLAVAGKSAAHLFGGGSSQGTSGSAVQFEGGDPVFDELDRAYDHAAAHTRTLYDTRGVGIDELIGNLNEANSPSIASQILQVVAIAGLAAASEALATALVAKVVAEGASELMKALVKEAASDGIKDATGKVASAIAGSSESKVGFLAGQKAGVLSLRGAAETELADQRASAKGRIRKLEGTDRTTAMTTATAAAWDVGNKLKSGVDGARTTQYVKSMSSWMDAQSRASMGQKDGGGADLAGDVDNHPKQNVGGGDGNGVVYISYGMSQNKRPKGGTMFVRGITDAVRDRIADVPLRDLNLPIVATGFITDGSFGDAMSVSMMDDNKFGMGRNPDGHVWVSSDSDAAAVAKKLTNTATAVEAARVILEQDLGGATLKNAHT